jgi:capsule polysaccharide export protein KpsE/RkpR
MFLGAALVALVASFFVPRIYESQAAVLYEGVPLLESRANSAPSAFVKSALVPSRLRELRERLGWDVPLSSLRSRVEATLESETAVRFVAKGPTAEEAYMLAQALLDVFLEHHAAFNAKEIERLLAENEISLQRANERREEAQAAFNAFREKSGKPDLLDEKEQLLQRAADLRAREDEAAVEIAAQSALIAELEEARRDLPRQIIGQATKGSPVDAPLAKAKAELAQARATLSEEHPRVKALKVRVANLKSQRGSEPAEIGARTLVANPARATVEEQLATARAALAAAEERQAAIRVLLENIQRESEVLAPAEGEARQTMGALDAAVARVEELTVRVAALRDASLTSVTGFRVLSAPVLPEQAKMATEYVALLALLPILAVLVYALVLLVRGLRTLRVEAPREVAWWGNGPVLGTSVWPRQPDALKPFVDELEDQGIYGAGRTLVVPATETERDIACSFAIQLAEAPWLAAAILDVGERSKDKSHLVTPPPSTGADSDAPPKRLSSQGTPSVPHGRAVPHKPTMQGVVPPSGGQPSTGPGPIVTPAPKHGPSPGKQASSRPPRKRTVIGLPAVQSSADASVSKPIPIEAKLVTSSTVPPAPSSRPPKPSSGLQPFQRKRGTRATVRMVVSASQSGAASESASRGEPPSEEEAFLLTRPVPVATEETPQRVGRAVHVRTEMPYASASDAVMSAAVRLLGDGEDDVTQLRASYPPKKLAADDVTAVALAWNGPLSGPLLRRAARLAHRVMVVVSSGLSAVELTRIKTRLGREQGVGYVLVNLEDAYLDTEDRVGAVEQFWQGTGDAESAEPRLP